ncbi:hypothetical protein D9611_010578 [Ephemerocybe angulata]|uniref:Rab-GAP TBC domain-containing protein n=1 Tax=Ephemerocybe angulata TaxID=980116 RepID=A0A8H5BWB0_9AGAR|nr:hypothetical protein D9611_010578 [Tulosesus angulatus]
MDSTSNKTVEDDCNTTNRGTAGGRGDIDWEGLRQLSLRPGGFREERVSLWPKLLKVKVEAKGSSKEGPDNTQDCPEDTPEPHSDENQIKLDTNRSFVMYPVDLDATGERDTLKDDLHELLVSVFRKRRKLHYFQGYHDIASVLYLTLPPELHLACIEKLSLHRVRDCMVSTLDPVVGLLRVTKNLLRLADPQYADMLDGNSPLPFFALSNLMTLFSHDMPTLPLIQHVFDYLLCRPPIAALYLTVTIILTRKPEALRLQEEGDEGMIHSLLNQLPDLVDDIPAPEELTSTVSVTESESRIPVPVPEEPPESQSSKELDEHPDSPDVRESPQEPPSKSDSVPLSSTNTSEANTPDAPKITESLEESVSSYNRAGRRLSHASRTRSTSRSLSSMGRLSRSRSSTLSRNGSVTELVPSLPHMAALVTADGTLEELPSPTATAAPVAPQHPEDSNEGRRNTKPRVQLSDLLTQADDLYRQFPPDHPDLKLSSIMGPQSVVFTWKEDGQDQDDEAEAMILHPELIVYPEMPDPSNDDAKKEGESDPYDSDSSPGLGVKKGGKRLRRKLQKTRRLDSRTKTMVAGAIIVLGVAMAVYGIKQRGGATMAFPQGAQKKWSQGRQWFGSALAGAAANYVRGWSGGDGREDL